MERLVQVVLCLLICSSVKCSEEEITEVSYEVEEYGNLMYDDQYDDDMFFSKITPLDEGRNMKNTSYNTLNCFGLSGKFASLMDSYFKQDANGTDALKVIFYSSSRNQATRVAMQHEHSFSLKNVDFDITKRTVFIVHGFFSHGNEDWIENMERALLKWDDVNIFIVDWSDGAVTWNYLKAAVNTRTVGDQIATFLGQIAQEVTENNGPSVEQWGPLHLIGHSLGAHICGYAAHELKQRNSEWPIHRITGLDPAQPCFRHSNMALRLDRSDAQFVDVIHTNGRILRKLGLGLPYPLGHVDFYPNGGGIQPGCFLTSTSVWNYLPLPIDKIKKTICSHGRSHIYLTESVITAVAKNCTFWAQEWDMSYSDVESLLSMKCDSCPEDRKCIEMGINAEKYDSNGTFFAITGGKSPFCNVDSSAIEEIKKLIDKIKKGFMSRFK